MASALIHIAICNELNKKLKRNSNKILIGTIAPDISKLVGESKLYTHFLDDENTDIPNINKFLSKYKNDLSDDFVLGYYIHLYTDYLWFKYFVPEVYNKDKNLITRLDCTTITVSVDEMINLIYNDYTNLNKKLVEKYDLNLKFLYDYTPNIDNIISEAHVDKIKLIIDKVKQIYEDSYVKKDIIFNMENVDNFINLSIELIESELHELNILNN